MSLAPLMNSMDFSHLLTLPAGCYREQKPIGDVEEVTAKQGQHEGAGGVCSGREFGCTENSPAQEVPAHSVTSQALDNEGHVALIKHFFLSSQFTMKSLPQAAAQGEK